MAFLAAAAAALAASLIKGDKNSYTNIQEVTNNITQINQSSCTATVQNESGGNFIILDGVRVAGDVYGSITRIKTNASCIMSSSNEANIDNLLESLADQGKTTENSGFSLDAVAIIDKLKSQNNSIDIRQYITNNITQMNINTCSSNIINTESPNYTYIRGGSVGGSVIGSDTTAESSSSCTITNNSKLIIYNDILSDGDQSNDLKGFFTTLVIGFVVIIGIVIFGVIILFSTGAIGHVGYKKNKNQAPLTNQPYPPQPYPPQPYPPQPYPPQPYPPQPYPPQPYPPQPLSLQPLPPQPLPPQPYPPQPYPRQPLSLQPLPLQPLPLQPLPLQPLPLQPLPPQPYPHQPLPRI
jgi:hypothetical protein